MRISTFVILLLLLIFGVAFSEEKIYTNEDLEKYQDRPSRDNRDPRDLANIEKKIRTTTKEFQVPRDVPPENNQGYIDREIFLYMAGCPTLQNALDSKGGIGGGGVVRLMTRGRSIKEICETVGAGCKTCYDIGD